MNKYSYYTPTELAERLISFLPEKEYNSVIDICCGTWNLLSAAKKKYPNAQVHGVDIEENIANYMLEGATFTLSDGRKFAEQEKEKGTTYDLILSNPPFGKLSKQEVYWEKVSCESPFSALRSRRYELEMMLANIYLTHENSIVLFILPITFVLGDTFKEARKQIANAFVIHEIIELPINTFDKGKIKTVAIIIEKKENCRKKTYYRKAYEKDSTWEFETFSQIACKEIKQGNWMGNMVPIASKHNIELHRGTIHSGQMRDGGNIVLHCSSTFENGKWIPSVRHTNQQKEVHAEVGDVLINRIGKGAGYWCINNIDNVQVSDCIFVLKNVRDELVKKLTDNTMDDGRLNILNRGVSTTYITQEDIYRIIFS